MDHMAGAFFRPPASGDEMPLQGDPYRAAAIVLTQFPLDLLAAVHRDVVATLGLAPYDAWVLVLASCNAYGGHHPADAVQNHVSTQQLHTSWPPCPGHGHPLVPDPPVWRCQATNDRVSNIGELGTPAD